MCMCARTCGMFLQALGRMLIGYYRIALTPRGGAIIDYYYGLSLFMRVRQSLFSFRHY